MTRQEHVAWCKQRALKYIDAGDPENAFASMASDLSKHEETKDHPAIRIGFRMKMSGALSTIVETKKFIEGFN